MAAEKATAEKKRGVRRKRSESADDKPKYYLADEKDGKPVLNLDAPMSEDDAFIHSLKNQVPVYRVTAIQVQAQPVKQV
jgi:hypothetical protein